MKIAVRDRRQHERHPFITPVEVFWTAIDGAKRRVRGRSIDVSIYGMQVEVDAPIPPDTTVHLTVDTQALTAGANVRHCSQLCSAFRIGLEFEQTLLSEKISRLVNTLTYSSASA
jgi:hypothetical protein